MTEKIHFGSHLESRYKEDTDFSSEFDKLFETFSQEISEIRRIFYSRSAVY